MPVRKKPVRRKRFKTTKLKKKSNFSLVLRLVLFALLLLTLPVAYFLMTQTQDIRQQAAGCSEEEVNVEFKYTKNERGWGEREKFVIGDDIDVNCFAKTGMALLSNGKFTLKIDGENTAISSQYLVSQGRTVQNYPITKGGRYVFTCSNNAGCSDTDSFTVPQPEPVVPPDFQCETDAECDSGEVCYQPPMPECPSGTRCAQVMPLKVCQAVESISEDDATSTDIEACSNQSVADLNGDCLVDLKDYDLFLSEFIKRQ